MGSDSECDFETSHDYGTGPDDDHPRRPKSTKYQLRGKTYFLLEPAQTDEEAFEDYLERDERMAREEQAFEDFIQRRDERNAREAWEFERSVDRCNLETKKAKEIYARGLERKGLEEKNVQEDPNGLVHRLAHGSAAAQVPRVQSCSTCCSAPATTAVLPGGRPVLCDV